MINTNRRGFLTGLVSFAATAPAIVRAANIMPVRPYKSIDEIIKEALWRVGQDGSIYGRSPMLDAMGDLDALNWRFSVRATTIDTSLITTDGWASLRNLR